MKRPTAFLIAGFLLAARTACAELPAQDTLTLYHYAEKSWAVGTLHLSKPLHFRDDKLLVFPAQLVDLLWAPKQAKPRNVMLVHEVWPDDKDKPFLEDKDDIFAPIQLLPEHAYYKDNLPPTPRHQLLGGRRYVFRGDDIPEARKVLEAYLKAFDDTGANRLKDEVVAVASGLESKNQVVREDSVTWFGVFRTLSRDFDDRAIPSIKAYLAGSAPAEEKAKLVEALSAAKIESLRPVLKETAKRDDAAGAEALRALAEDGEKPTTDALLGQSRSSAAEIQGYAMEELGARAGEDDAAFGRCKELLADVKTPPLIVANTIAGLSRARGDRVEALLVSLVERGDDGARQAGAALAGLGSPRAEADLTRILKETKGESAIAAAGGLYRMPGCDPCAATLNEQYHSHPDESVRNLIGILLGVHMKHKH